MSIKALLKKCIPFKVRWYFSHKKYLNKLKKTDYNGYLRATGYLGEKVSFGKENKDKTFYLFAKDATATGLLSCYLTALGRFSIIEEKGYIPIVDMQSQYYRLIHNSKDEMGRVNAWEWFFERVSPYSLEDIKNSKNIILGYKHVGGEAMLFYDNTKITKEVITKWIPYDERYFHLVKSLKMLYEKTAKEMFDGKRVLGVMIREGYIVLGQAKADKTKSYDTNGADVSGHSVQPTEEEFLLDVERKMKEWNCDYIFICAETTYFIEKLEEKFGKDRIIYTKRRRRILDKLTYDDWLRNRFDSEQVESTRERNEKYLLEIYLLSKCSSMLAGKCSGSIVAALWNRGKYDNYEIISKGSY